MEVHLTRIANRQLEAMDNHGHGRVSEASELLSIYPRSGKAYSQETPFAEKEARYFLVRVTKRLLLRITCRIMKQRLVVLYVFPAENLLTHPDHLKLLREGPG